jgi:hypothetical protein
MRHKRHARQMNTTLRPQGLHHGDHRLTVAQVATVNVVRGMQVMRQDTMARARQFRAQGPSGKSCSTCNENVHHSKIIKQIATKTGGRRQKTK